MAANDRFWTDKLQSGLSFSLPPTVSHLADLYKLCRANLLILADDGQIHPGPTVYDSFWIRDSAIEGIAVTMAGDRALAARQFGTHYPTRFNQDPHSRIGPVSGYGFFGGRAEEHGLEWDSNGLALWAFGRFDRFNGTQWDVVLGCWNEQHCYPIAKDFAEVPAGSWYMGDIPHGWACAEFMMLIRDILFFEADEDGSPHVYIAPGVMPHWLADGQTIDVADAPTVFGDLFGYRLRHLESSKRIDIEITQHPCVSPWYIYDCPYGSSIASVEIDGRIQPIAPASSVKIPAGSNHITIVYQ